ncbi:dipeptide ABC transporter ATP-binding protein [Chthonobacter rhizosphaerae]|uniref:dipeptide ABC transporter ATP-binding protein n=1 Tax=Chthonobacter rhizosphaerae TaxID=2735553 RepID=UPI0015EEFAC7|nr:ABC transporter ATP-binding protein [Chthonobacter rhizosphaerae]
MTHPSVVSVQNLSVRLPRGADRPFAVEDVSLDVRRGEILCVVGESGSGKSVLSAAIMGALPRGLTFGGGSVRFGDRDLTKLRARDLRSIRGNEIAMVFQDPIASLNPAIPVGRQVEEVFEIHTDLKPEERRARALALLESTHLPEPARIHGAYPHQISGGQCQRVVIAMALALEPKLLIADEPTTALDVTTQAQILRLFNELRGGDQHGILFITHDFGVVREVADRVAVMRHGRLVEIGPAADVLDRPSHDYTRTLIASVPSLNPPARSTDLSAPPALKADDLVAFYGPVKALKDVSVSIPKGATLAVVGESGSGKSTLARTIIRLHEPDSGTIAVGGVDYTALKGRDLQARRRLVQMIFQNPFGSLNPRRTVGEVLMRAGVLGGADAATARRRALELLDLVRLPREAFDRRPDAFSGGQRQRISIARALAMNPEIVIADESVSALDVSVQAQVLTLLDDLQKTTGMTMLFITHDLRVAAQIADHIAVMKRGEVVEFGLARDVLRRPKHPYTRELVAAAPGQMRSDADAAAE